MAIDRDEVERLARLAGLALDPDEVGVLAEQLRGVLEHVVAVRGADASLAAPWSGPDDRAAPLRDDVEAFDPLVLPPEALAPEWRDSFFLVPRPPALGPDSPAGDAEREA